MGRAAPRAQLRARSARGAWPASSSPPAGPSMGKTAPAPASFPSSPSLLLRLAIAHPKRPRSHPSPFWQVILVTDSPVDSLTQRLQQGQAKPLPSPSSQRLTCTRSLTSGATLIILRHQGTAFPAEPAAAAVASAAYITATAAYSQGGVDTRRRPRHAQPSELEHRIRVADSSYERPAIPVLSTGHASTRIGPRHSCAGSWWETAGPFSKNTSRQ